MGEIIFIILALIFLSAALLNLKKGRDIEVFMASDLKMKIAFFVLGIVLILVGIRLNVGLIRWAFIFSFVFLTFTLITNQGFTKNDFIYFNGLNIFLSNKNIRKLYYIKTISKSRDNLLKILVRANLLKKEYYIKQATENTLIKILKLNKTDYFPIGTKAKDVKEYKNK